MNEKHAKIIRQYAALRWPRDLVERRKWVAANLHTLANLDGRQRGNRMSLMQRRLRELQNLVRP